MKTLIATVLLASGLVGTSVKSFATEQDSVKRDRKTLVIKFGSKSDTVRYDKNASKFISGLTFTRLDIGFSKLIDNGDFTLSPANDFLDYKPSKTSNVSFDVFQLGYRVNSNFKFYLAGGFDWTLIRLEKPITIQKNTTDLTYINEPILFSKNRFSSSYLHIPLNFELRSDEDKKGKRFYTVLGPEVAFLLSGKVKQISDERGKEKFKDDYNFQPFRYGASIRLGYGGTGVFAKYYFNDMFESAPQKGLRNMSFGITFGLN